MAVWRMDPGDPGGARPAALFLLMQFRADAVALRAAAWVPRESALKMAPWDCNRYLSLTAGHTGVLKFWDIQNAFAPVLEVPCSMDWVLCVSWLAQPMGVVAGQDCGMLRYFHIQGEAKKTNKLQCAGHEPWMSEHLAPSLCSRTGTLMTGLPAVHTEP